MNKKWEPSVLQKRYWDSLRGKSGKDTPHWKGDNAGKSAVHKWLDTVYGKPKFCEGCGSQEKRSYDWANTIGEYKRNRKYFLRLCTSCHRKFDMTETKRMQAIKNLNWVTKTVRVSKLGVKFNEKFLV